MIPSSRIGIRVAICLLFGCIFFHLSAQQSNYTLSPLSIPLTGLSGMIYPDDIYIFGGQDAGGTFYSSTQHQLHCNACGWTARSPMPTPRAYATAVKVTSGTLNGITVVIGGKNGFGALNTVEAYNPANDTWITLPSMIFARSNLKATLLNGNIHVFGGYNGTNVLNVHEVFNTSTLSWSIAPPMPSPLMDFGIGTLTELGVEYGYIFGGRTHPTNVNSIVATNTRYDPVLQSYASRAPMPIARAAFAATSEDFLFHRLYAYGGYTNPGGPMTDSIHIYEFGSNSWSPHGFNLDAPAAEFWGQGFWDARTTCAFNLITIGGRTSTGTIIGDSRSYYVQSGPFAIANDEFYGSSSVKAIDLTWSIETPMDVSHFELMHSLDGTNFSPAGEKIEAGSLSEWHFKHDIQTAGMHYYALRTFDMAGVQQLNLQTQVLVQSDGSGEFSLFPNPSAGNLSLRFSENQSQKEVELLSLDGKRVFYSQLPTASSQELDFSRFPSGMYVIRIRSGNAVSQQRLILQ